MFNLTQDLEIAVISYCLVSLALLLTPIANPYKTYIECLYRFFSSRTVEPAEKLIVFAHIAMLVIFLPIVALLSEIIMVIDLPPSFIALVTCTMPNCDELYEKFSKIALSIVSIALLFTVFGCYQRVKNKLAI